LYVLSSLGWDLGIEFLREGDVVLAETGRELIAFGS